MSSQAAITDQGPSPTIELRVLGALDLRGTEGVRLDAILTHPKRVALLTYLAVARPRGFQRRDLLLALLWPERDDEHARGALNQALHQLRHTLGPDVLVSRGTEEVGLAPSRLWCDVAAFDAAESDGRLEQALELYRGELLQGFHVSGAGEYERWLDAERARLKDAALHAAWVLAEQQEAAGNAVAAGHWARRAAELAADDEVALRRVLELLDRVGDRAGAIRVYDDFARRLHEIEVEPVPETEELMIAVRGRARATRPPNEPLATPRTVAAPPLPQPWEAPTKLRPYRRRLWTWAGGLVAVLALALGARAAWGPLSRFFRIGETAVSGRPDWLIVADFDGPPDDPGLAGAVRELVASALEESRFVAIVPRDQIRQGLELAGKPATARVDAELARELAIRGNVRAVLTGRVDRVGRTFSVVLRVIDADTGTVLVSGRATASSPDEVIPTTDHLAREIGTEFGQVRGAIRAPQRFFEPVATPSFEAYRRFVEAVTAQLDQGDDERAMRLYREALALDSAFALDRLALAIMFVNGGMRDSARAALAETRRHTERLSEGRRLYLEALDAALRRDYAAAARWFGEEVQANPSDGYARHGRAVMLGALGRYEEQAKETEYMIAHSPFGPDEGLQADYVGLLCTLGRWDEARQVAQTLTLRAFGRDLWPVLFALAHDEWDGAAALGLALHDDATAGVPERRTAAIAHASALAARGFVRAADSLLRWAARLPQDSHGPAAARAPSRGRLLLIVASGLPPNRFPLPEDTPSDLGGHVQRGLWAAVRGDTATARRVQETLQASSADEVAEAGVSFTARVLPALLHAHGGRWEDVIRILAPALRSHLNGIGFSDEGMWALARWLVADAYAHLGHPDSAVSDLEILVDPAGALRDGEDLEARGLISSFAHQRLVVLYARLGRVAEAQRHWKAFQEAFTRPDPELVPLIKEARQALPRTGGVRQ